MPKKKLGNGDLVTKYINHIKEDKTRGVSSGTIKTYTNIGNNLPFNMLSSQPVIIRKLKDLYSNPNTLQLYLNMIILLRRHNDEETDKLVRMRNGLRDVIIKLRKQKLDTLDDVLPNRDYLLQQLDKLASRRYIINYLMVHHALRNKDINLKFVKTLPDEKDENYIFVQRKNVTVYITDYKTEAKYGDKTIKINNPRFISELKGMNLKDGDYILPLKNGKKISSTTTFNDKILKLTIDSLGQGKIAKIVIKELLNKKAFDKLETLSKDRGTSMEVLLKSYNLHTKADKETDEDTKEDSGE
tara:strand:+ start:3268 stop:4167 length:900 start_codon:yes stop_codon:yes gene_type:complete